MKICGYKIIHGGIISATKSIFVAFIFPFPFSSGSTTVKSNESIEFAVFRILQEKRKTTGV